MSEVTFYLDRNQHVGMKAEDAKRLREFEIDNVRLKRLVADLWAVRASRAEK